MGADINDQALYKSWGLNGGALHKWVGLLHTSNIPFGRCALMRLLLSFCRSPGGGADVVQRAAPARIDRPVAALRDAQHLVRLEPLQLLHTLQRAPVLAGATSTS